MKEKILSLFLAATIVLSGIAVASTAYAKIYDLTLNVKTGAELEGAGDLARFTFTPEASGTYSFLSYSDPATQAFLYVRETDPVTHLREYILLAAAIDDPNYAENDHNFRQFCLTYHLEAGVTYYFDAGWYSDTRTSGKITVMLRCDEYDVVFEKIEARCPIVLDVYTDGFWTTDANGQSYFFYNITKISANTVVTLYYPDGTVSESALGADTVDGYSIQFIHDQYYNHWYPQTDANYTGNRIRVQVLGQYAELEIPIVSSAMYPVSGVITDLQGEPLQNAQVFCGNGEVARTDETGRFSFPYTAGYYVFSFCCENGVKREKAIAIAAGSNNDFTDEPIRLCTFDYVPDGIVNAKDFAVMQRTLEGEELAQKTAAFSQYINFTAAQYEAYE